MSIVHIYLHNCCLSHPVLRWLLLSLISILSAALFSQVVVVNESSLRKMLSERVLIDLQ